MAERSRARTRPQSKLPYLVLGLFILLSLAGLWYVLSQPTPEQRLEARLKAIDPAAWERFKPRLEALKRQYPEQYAGIFREDPWSGAGGGGSVSARDPANPGETNFGVTLGAFTFGNNVVLWHEGRCYVVELAPHPAPPAPVENDFCR